MVDQRSTVATFRAFPADTLLVAVVANWQGNPDLSGILNADGVDGGSAPAQGLGKHRWPVERALAWLQQYRRAGIHPDRQADIYNAFVTLACALIAFRKSLPTQF